MTTTAQSHPNTARVHKPVHTPSADGDLVAQFQRALVSRREHLYRHALRLSRNHADAEDLVQETMLKAYMRFDSFRSGTNLNAWLFRILLNTYINAYRQKRRHPVLCSTEQLTDQHLAQAYTRAVPMGLRSAEDVALDALPDSAIKAAMLALPRQIRAVVYYADVEGLRIREIASIMKSPTGTVTSRLHRGRRQLRRLLTGGVNHLESPETVPAAA